MITQPVDFMGQNIYNGYMLRAGADGEPEFMSGPTESEGIDGTFLDDFE